MKGNAAKMRGSGAGYFAKRTYLARGALSSETVSSKRQNMSVADSRQMKREMNHPAVLIKRWSLVTGSVAIASALGFAPVASASSNSKTPTCASGAGTKVMGALDCQGLASYKGKTMTFVAADNVGGGYDEYARDYAPYLAKYLDATVNVVNIPAGNTVAGQNAVAGSTPNGLEVGWLNAGPDIEDNVLHIQGVQFNPEGISMLGGTAPNLAVVVALKSPACASWDNGFASGLASNSASNVLTEPIQTTGSTTYSLLMMDGVFGIHYRALTGYSSTSNLISGWERGDGCVINATLSSVAGLITSGRAVPLLMAVPIQPSNIYAKDFQNVPTMAQAVTKYAKYIKTKTQKAGVTALLQSVTTPRTFFVPPKTPQAEQAILRDAFKWASENPSMKSLLTSQGNGEGFETGKQAKTNYIAFLKFAGRTTEYLAAIG